MPFAAAPWATIRAVSARPTKEIASTPGLVEQRVDRVAAAVDEVDDAGRDLLDRVDQLDDQRRRPRVLLGGLEHEGVAAGDRVRQEPERDHRREVERGDRGDDADRLAHHLDVDAGGDALERLALQQVRDRRRRLDRLDPAADLAVGVGERLAHVGGDQRGQLARAAEQRLAQRQHRPRPLLRRDLAPARLRRPRRLDRRRGPRAAPESGTSAATSPLAGIDVVERLDARRPRARSRRRSCAAGATAAVGDPWSAAHAVSARSAGAGTASCSGRTAAIFSARRCCQVTKPIASTVTPNSIIAITLTSTGIPRWAAPKM